MDNTADSAEHPAERLPQREESETPPTRLEKGETLRALRGRLEEIGHGTEAPGQVRLGACTMRFGAVHEWCSVESVRDDAAISEAEQPRAMGGPRTTRGASRRPMRWTPPLTLLAGVACEAMRSGTATRLIWIGRRVFPHAVFLARQHPSFLEGSLFVDACERDARVWAIDVSLRSGVPACVIGDGQGITLAESRRLQVAARCGRAIALLARPGHEAGALSAAATRWRVGPVVLSDGRAGRMAWTLTLDRSKGESMRMDATSLTVEWRDAKGLVVVPALVASRASRETRVAAS